MWDHVKMSAMTVPKSVAYAVLQKPDEAVKRKRERTRSTWMRYGRKHATCMRHTDYKQTDDGRRLTSCEDDVSHFIVR